VTTNMKLVCKDWGLEFANWKEWKEAKEKQSYMHIKTRKKMTI